MDKMEQLDFTPLGEATLEDIMEELGKRYDAYVFACRRDTEKDKSDNDLWRRGDYITCVGLCKVAETKILNSFFEKNDESTE